MSVFYRFYRYVDLDEGIYIDMKEAIYICVVISERVMVSMVYKVYVVYICIGRLFIYIEGLYFICFIDIEGIVIHICTCYRSYILLKNELKTAFRRLCCINLYM